MIIVDASALTAALTEDSPRGRAASSALDADSDWAAPDHLFLETLAAIRSRNLRGVLPAASASRAVARLRTLAVTRIELEPMLERIWEMRDSVTVYDAAYVAAAEMFDCPLVTTDVRLARYPQARCSFIVPGAS